MAARAVACKSSIRTEHLPQMVALKHYKLTTMRAPSPLTRVLTVCGIRRNGVPSTFFRKACRVCDLPTTVTGKGFSSTAQIIFERGREATADTDVARRGVRR